MVNIKSFPLVEDNVAPERVSVFIPTLSVAVTVKVTVLDCADVSKLTMFELLLLVKLLITGLWSSSVVIVIFLVLQTIISSLLYFYFEKPILKLRPNYN